MKSYSFTDLPSLVPSNSVLVMNTTKVIRARLTFFRQTGARIEVFCLEPYAPALYELSLSAKHEVIWHCLVGQSRKWKEEYLCQLLADGTLLKVSRVNGNCSGGNLIRFEWSNDMTFGELLEHLGELPIPPYLNRDTEESDLRDYQTVYAREEGSVAAPTAGLHFTEGLLSKLNEKGIDQIPITLHVGAGTFLPVKSATMGEHEMHTEVIEVRLSSLRSIYDSLLAKRPIVSVGTTSTRTLESLYYMGVQVIENVKDPLSVPQWIPYQTTSTATTEEAIKALIDYLKEKGVDRLFGQTQLIIVPGYTYRLVDFLITNFHQPNSTLLLLVAAFVGDDWHKIYDFALKNDYRFLSYGDGSLLKKKA
ncbi:S-adenosylmethionine:tRNA ribosyltransferase-isomerase [uncultured Porphyromonas sp.]|uniref:S-adenosylmethionine:tRNA ribosyltransferase-isomerase n=1 Tax=uncultured Porphyromonas sp. TaxID=159274 RepID=UPI002634DE83|nr:S-adenosylmethionine:tRNA ribosyltransferase-isomerase [uncultured Porphyromonas sp.]